MPAAAEFQVFTDQNGNRHVSKISPAGLTRSGNLKPAYSPNSVVHQYPLMLERLRLQREELAREAMVARAAQAKKAERDSKPKPVARKRQGEDAGPKEGMLGLQGLIQLEKRGGRWNPE